MRDGMVIQNNTYQVVADSESEAIENAKKAEERAGHQIVEVLSVRQV